MTKGKEKQPEFAPKCAEIWPKKKKKKWYYLCAHIKRPLLKYDVYLRSYHCQEVWREPCNTSKKKLKELSKMRKISPLKWELKSSV